MNYGSWTTLAYHEVGFHYTSEFSLGDAGQNGPAYLVAGGLTDSKIR